MIFAALLESGTGAVHAINERIATAWQRIAAARELIAPRARGARRDAADRLHRSSPTGSASSR